MLQVLDIQPANNSIDISIDSKIRITFDQAIDPFSVSNGISLYTPTDGQWIGPEASILDTELKDVLDIGQDYSYFSYDFTIEGNTVIITPQASLLPERKFYVAVYPGSDAERYISASTVSTLTYERAGVSEGTVNIVSSYLGEENGSYRLDFDGNGNFDLTRDGSVYLGQFSYTENSVVELDDINLSITGSFDAGDTVSFDVFTAQGTDSIYRVSFTTSQYKTFEENFQSTEITTIESAQVIPSIKLVNSIPDNLSVDNTRINPITLKFSESLDLNQDISSEIVIRLKDIDTGRVRRVNYYYKINNEILKLYLLTLK